MTARLSGALKPGIVVVEFAALLAAWQLAVALQMLNPFFYPPPTEVVGAFFKMLADGRLTVELAYSARAFASGFALAAVAGVLLGLVFGTYLPVERLLGPIAWALYSAPLVAIRPMTFIWFGFGAAPIVFLVFVSSVFPILFNTAAGVRTVNPSLVRAGRVFGSSRLQLYWKIRLPWTMPYVLAGFRIAVPAGVIGLLVGELLGAPHGIGALIAYSTNQFNTADAFAGLVLLIVLTVLLVQVVGVVERLVATQPWRRLSGR